MFAQGGLCYFCNDPLPKAEATRTFRLSADEAIHNVNEWGGRPLPLSATAYANGVLHVRRKRHAVKLRLQDLGFTVAALLFVGVSYALTIGGRVFVAVLERVTRIELAFSAWEADVLPLNYTRA